MQPGQKAPLPQQQANPAPSQPDQKALPDHEQQVQPPAPAIPAAPGAQPLQHPAVQPVALPSLVQAVTLVHGDLPTPHQIQQACAPLPGTAHAEENASLPQQQAKLAPSQPAEKTAAPETDGRLPATPHAKQEITEAELQAMGWQVPSSCKPLGQPATATASAGAAAMAQQQQRPSAVQHPSAVQQPTLQNSKQEQKQQVFQPVQHMNKNNETYSRRAAANLINRLRDNPARVQGMPSLHALVFDESRKSELILCVA